MEINVKRWNSYSSISNSDTYCVSVRVDGCRVEEDCLSQAEVDTLATSFIEDTLLRPVSYSEVIEKLLEVGILSEEMIYSWVKVQKDEDDE